MEAQPSAISRTLNDWAYAMKTILVLAGGREADASVFDAALAIAKPLQAHLEFLHVRISAGEAAAYTPHVDFARGAGLRSALARLEDRAVADSRAALDRFEELREKGLIEVAIGPRDAKGDAVAASWGEECDDAVARMTHCARHNDLVVVGRPSRSNGLPSDFVEQLLVSSGRPILLAPHRARKHRTGVAVVCWKETAESARALAAATPLLLLSERVVLVSVAEGGGDSLDCLDHLARRLQWDGIKAETMWVAATDISAAERLETIATDLDADLVVMGGYGHGRTREMVFGGCTQRFLERGDRPILMMH